MITAQVENFSDVLPELMPILPIHYEELALNKDKVPLDPMWEIYDQRNERGELLFVSLRESGRLIGYFIGFINPALHYRSCLTCIMDIFYVYPEFRGNKAGFTLFNFVEKELKRRGVMRWFVGSKCHMDASWMFERLGFERVEVYYSKMIGD